MRITNRIYCSVRMTVMYETEQEEVYYKFIDPEDKKTATEKCNNNKCNTNTFINVHVQ